MPFALCSVLPILQRLMDTAPAVLKRLMCLVYMDDVIYAPTFDEHLQRLDAVLYVIKTSGLTLKAEKCHFAYQELKSLSRVVS